MKCKFCNVEVNAEKAFCHICKFPLFKQVEKLSEESINSMLEKYAVKMKNISIFLTEYDYMIDNLDEPDQSSVGIFKVSDLKMHEIVYLDDEFEDIPSAIPFDIDIILSIGNDKQKYKLPMKPKKNISHKKIGVYLDDGLTFKMAVGSGENVVYSQPISFQKAFE